MSLLIQPLWPMLKPYLVVEHYDRDGGHDDPRIRIELRDLPADLATVAADLLMPCVTCHRRIFPLRQREGDPWSRLYYAPTCSLERNVACSRSGPARVEYDRFRELWDSTPRPPAQMRMFA